MADKEFTHSTADFKHVKFSNADFKYVQFNTADFNYVEFSNADLTYVQFSTADFNNVEVSTANCSTAEFDCKCGTIRETTIEPYRRIRSLFVAVTSHRPRINSVELKTYK